MDYLVEREITKNDIRARILVIPQAIKYELNEHESKFVVVFNGVEKKLNIDKGRSYFGGITDLYKKFGLLSPDGAFYSKKAQWKMSDGKIIIDLV